MKMLFFVFVFFIPLSINIGGNIKTNKLKNGNNKFSIKFAKKETNKKVFEWKNAEASYYDNYDPSQTRDGCNGIGAFGRRIKSGSVALGSFFAKKLKKENRVIFIKIRNFNVTTPYGKGIFRVDDIMAKKFRVKNKYKIDFLEKDLNNKLKQKGRFIVKFMFL